MNSWCIYFDMSLIWKTNVISQTNCLIVHFPFDNYTYISTIENKFKKKKLFYKISYHHSPKIWKHYCCLNHYSHRCLSVVRFQSLVNVLSLSQLILERRVKNIWIQLKYHFNIQSADIFWSNSLWKFFHMIIIGAIG